VEFKIQKILDSLNKKGVEDELANKVAKRVQIRLYKMDQPISKSTIKKVIINELKKDKEKKKAKGVKVGNIHWK